MKYQITALLMGLIICVSGALQAQQSQSYSITQVTDDLYRVANNTHRTLFLVTDEGIILADPVNVNLAAWLRSELDERFDVPVKYVLYSHYHADHASGGSYFSDTAVFVGHEKMADGVASLSSAAAANIVLPTVTFSDQMAVSLGGQTVELHHAGPAHSDDMTVLYFKEQRVSFGVDYANVQRFPSRLNGYHIDQYAHGLGVLADFDADQVVIGHGDIIGTNEDINNYRNFLLRIQTEVNEAIAEGKTLAQTQSSVLLEEYSHWQSFADRRAGLVADAYNLISSSQ